MPSTSNDDSVINMRVTANSIQGHRKYMEDCYKIRFQRESSLMNSQNQKLLNAANSAGYFAKNKNIADENDPQSDILFSYFGIFDGHGGKEASQFAKEKLYWKIVEQEDFWSEDHAKVLNAIREGFIQCHMDMWNELGNWPKTASGLPSTSGSTATVLFIRKSKAYVGHVGDSGLLIGYSKDGSESNSYKNNIPWQARKLTRDHKPEDPVELKRIESMGGAVAVKSGVNRVVWNRPILNPNKHKSNKDTNQSNNLVKSQNSVPYDLSHYKSRPTQIQTERIPFLAVARSLGDLWSYDINRDEFIVSPVPDVFHFDLDPTIHKCLILATDGLWNVMRANECVDLVRQTDKETEKLNSENQSNRTDLIVDPTGEKPPIQPFVNPSQRLVNTAMQRCCEKMIRADNTSCITIMLDQPPSYEDYLTNSNETVITSTNLTNLDINKTFDQTGKILNISDDFDEEDLEKNEESIFANNDLSDYAVARAHRDRKKRKSTSSKAFNLTTSTEIPDSEFTTPLSNDKRSRSLISVRRRRWSASSQNNRSNSVMSTHNSQQKESRSRINSGHRSASNNNTNHQNRSNKLNNVNMDNREQRLVSANNTHKQINRQYMTKSSSSNAVSYRETRSNKIQQQNDLYQNKSNMHLDKTNETNNQYNNGGPISFDQETNDRSRVPVQKRNKTRTSALTLRLREHPTNYSSRKSLLNASSISVGVNRLSKSLRKSCNDLYTMSKNLGKNQRSENSENSFDKDNISDGKENQEKPNDSDDNINKSSKYSKRLRKLKNRLIQTKNTLFKNKNRKSNGQNNEDLDKNKGFDNNQSKHQSMPNLSKIELDDKGIEFIDKNEDFSDYESGDEGEIEGSDEYVDIENLEQIEGSAGGQSFVDNVKTKLNNLKRKNGISKKSLHLQGNRTDIDISNETSNPVNSTTRKQNKRIKFF